MSSTETDGDNGFWIREMGEEEADDSECEVAEADDGWADMTFGDVEAIKALFAHESEKSIEFRRKVSWACVKTS